MSLSVMTLLINVDFPNLLLLYMAVKVGLSRFRIFVRRSFPVSYQQISYLKIIMLCKHNVLEHNSNIVLEFVDNVIIYFIIAIPP